MGAWGFVFLAYGIVWIVLLFYIVMLQRRLQNIEAELSKIRSPENQP